MVKAPGAAARTWAMQVTNGACKSALGDSFHFEIQNQRDIKGMPVVFEILSQDSGGLLNLFQAILICHPVSFGSMHLMMRGGMVTPPVFIACPRVVLLQAASK